MASSRANCRTSFLLLLTFIGLASAQLSPNFYSSRCPNALSIISSGIRAAVSSEARMGASLVRLHFHDCFVNGCDGSILLDDTPSFRGEKTAGPNVNSVRGFNVIDNIKTQLERACPGVVSCADILTVAARDSVVALGGPTWTVPLGRRDSTTASLNAANSNLPGPQSSLNALISAFANKGLTVRELVALSGAHTIGQARCVNFRNRIYTETNIQQAFAIARRQMCPRSGGDNLLSPIDSSPDTFDNAYFNDLLRRRGLFHSDQVLFNNGPTDAQVRAYSTNPASFNNDFAAAMIKMSRLSPLTGSNGQIRRNCRRVN